MNGKYFHGSKLTVQWSGKCQSERCQNLVTGENRKSSGNGPSDKDVCSNRGKRGHW